MRRVQNCNEDEQYQEEKELQKSAAARKDSLFLGEQQNTTTTEVMPLLHTVQEDSPPSLVSLVKAIAVCGKGFWLQPEPTLICWSRETDPYFLFAKPGRTDPYNLVEKLTLIPWGWESTVHMHTKSAFRAPSFRPEWAFRTPIQA